MKAEDRPLVPRAGDSAGLRIPLRDGSIWNECGRCLVRGGTSHFDGAARRARRSQRYRQGPCARLPRILPNSPRRAIPPAVLPSDPRARGRLASRRRAGGRDRGLRLGLPTSRRLLREPVPEQVAPRADRARSDASSAQADRCAGARPPRLHGQVPPPSSPPSGSTPTGVGRASARPSCEPLQRRPTAGTRTTCTSRPMPSTTSQ